MKDDQPPLSVDSSSWTGPPPKTADFGSYRSSGLQPRLDLAEQRTLRVACALLGAGHLAYLIWFVVLASHSPVTPSPESGHTEALELFGGRLAPPMYVYITPAEAAITHAFLVAAYVVPVAYVLGREALGRCFKR
jgi:hypothetical protein